VKRLARWVAMRYPVGVEHDDLVQAGLIGLHEAFQRYDGRDGVALLSFAHHRVVGAMIDEMRQADPMARTHRAEGATVSLVDIDGDEVPELQADTATPEHQLERRQLRALMLHLVDGLPTRERQVIVGIYLGERELRDVGADLDVSDTYVCHIRRRALEILRVRMAAALAGTDGHRVQKESFA
jgi:RNA polymerase sigma factor for flagellar operon FliA